MSSDQFDRRDFLKRTGTLGAGVAAAASSFAKANKANNKLNSSRVIGANDRINDRCDRRRRTRPSDATLSPRSARKTMPARSSPSADIYQKRVTTRTKTHKCDGYLGLSRDPQPQADIDAVIVATPDHWHARDRARSDGSGQGRVPRKADVPHHRGSAQLVATVKETGRVLQVGSQTTSADQWWKAKKAIADGMIGKMIMSQGSYHRNSVEGEWNYTIDEAAGPEGKGEDYIDWKMWLGQGAGASLRRRPLFPLPQILGLFRRHRDRSVLSRGRAAEHLLGQAAVSASK